MGFTARCTKQPHSLLLTLLSTVLLCWLLTNVLRTNLQLEGRHTRDMMGSTAEPIDPAAIDLTPLVNTLINSSQSGSRQLFSLLSVTSYSSLALHRLTLLVYNISNISSVGSHMFRRRFCYCITNQTNDLTDFAAILLDIMGNSTSYLHELFKSASVVSVSQRNNSDCIYICLMAGKMGGVLPHQWDVESVSPLFNQTIVEGPRGANVSSHRLPVGWHLLPTNLSHGPPSGMSSPSAGRVHSTAHGSPSPLAAGEPLTSPAHPLATVTSSQTAPPRPPATTGGGLPTPGAVAPAGAAPSRSTAPPQAAAAPTQSQVATETDPAWLSTRHLTTSTPLPTRPSNPKPTVKHTTVMRTTVPIMPLETEKPGGKHVEDSRLGNGGAAATSGGCPWERPELTGDSGIPGSMTTVGAHKLQPCVFELCKFFSECLCRPLSLQTRMKKRYCDSSHIWYEMHTLEVCRRVKRISFSRNLKQRCLRKMCNNL